MREALCKTTLLLEKVKAQLDLFSCVVCYDWVGAGFFLLRCGVPQFVIL